MLLLIMLFYRIHKNQSGENSEELFPHIILVLMRN